MEWRLIQMELCKEREKKEIPAYFIACVQWLFFPRFQSDQNASVYNMFAVLYNQFVDSKLTLSIKRIQVLKWRMLI